MINLALDCINERAHYYVMQSPKGNYIFETALGIHYSISFEEDTHIEVCRLRICKRVLGNYYSNYAS